LLFFGGVFLAPIPGSHTTCAIVSYAVAEKSMEYRAGYSGVCTRIISNEVPFVIDKSQPNFYKF